MHPVAITARTTITLILETLRIALKRLSLAKTLHLVPQRLPTVVVDAFKVQPSKVRVKIRPSRPKYFVRSCRTNLSRSRLKNWPTFFLNIYRVRHLRELRPNPSFKPSPNGVPRGPGRRYAVHFRHPGPRVTPPVPA